MLVNAFVEMNTLKDVPYNREYDEYKKGQGDCFCFHCLIIVSSFARRAFYNSIGHHPMQNIANLIF